ncbi:MAG: hypothetical protein ACRDTD_08060 [Pseudonocardiaceae bacterium]
MVTSFVQLLLVVAAIATTFGPEANAGSAVTPRILTVWVAALPGALGGCAGTRRGETSAIMRSVGWCE